MKIEPRRSGIMQKCYVMLSNSKLLCFLAFELFPQNVYS